MLDPCSKLVTDNSVANVDKELFRQFQNLFGFRESQHDFRDIIGMLEDVMSRESVILWNVEVLDLVRLDVL